MSNKNKSNIEKALSNFMEIATTEVQRMLYHITSISMPWTLTSRYVSVSRDVVINEYKTVDINIKSVFALPIFQVVKKLNPKLNLHICHVYCTFREIIYLLSWAWLQPICISNKHRVQEINSNVLLK